MEPTMILIIVNLVVSLISPIIKLFSRTKKSKCCSGAAEINFETERET